MRIVVCIKEILDPEIASSVFGVDEEANRVCAVPGMRLVMSPFDAQAIEVALRLRDSVGEAVVTLLTLGAESARTIVKQGLALGADDAVMLVDSHFDDGDSYTTARALAAAIVKIGDVDLVLAGRQAADWDRGVVGSGIAELLDLPAVTFATSVAVEGNALVVERTLGDYSEIVEVSMPAVVTVSHEVGSVRHASLRETMRAARKPVTLWNANDLALVPTEVGSAGARSVLERLYIPRSDVVCEFVTGETHEVAAANLIARLTEAGFI